MNYIVRDRSVITGKRNLEPLHLMKNYPVFFGCVDHPVEQDLRADLSWAICPESGVIQLDKLIPPEILYQEQHVDGTGPTWAKYYDDFSDFLKERSGTRVLEIGGGAGQLAERFARKRPDSEWVIVEANPLHPGAEQIRIKRAFFDNEFSYEEELDTIVYSQVLEHAYEPNEFLANCWRLLPSEGQLLFAYPNLRLWLERKYTNAINFEHCMFLTDYFVDCLLRRAGFELVEKLKYNDHSYFYSCRKVSKPAAIGPFVNHYAEYKKIYDSYRSHYESMVGRLNSQIREFGAPVYVFGAHIFAQSLFQFGLDESLIAGLLDNSKLKIGRRLYGTRLRVSSPEILRNAKAAGVVMNVGVYRDEICRQLMSLNDRVKIFE